MFDALEEHDGKMHNSNQFAFFVDGIDKWWARIKTESIRCRSRQNVNRLENGDECWDDQTDMSASDTQKKIHVKGRKLEPVTSLK